MTLAADYLRPHRAEAVQVIESEIEGNALKLLIRGYEQSADPNKPTDTVATNAKRGDVEESIAEDLFGVLRTGSHLAFANTRADVEMYADLLRTRCEQDGIPPQFFPHHGSLSKDLWEHAEEMVKDPVRPATAICTSTLELGIDIGRVESVAQVGSPFSVASLRQRLGRSGRRGEPAVLRMYISEASLNSETSPVDAIRAKLVQSIALVRLLLSRWCEPPNSGGLHLSTLIHQILSIISERGGISPPEAWRTLCGQGAFLQHRAASVCRAVTSHGRI
jgi:ATP-dependent helicase Lhr and Lhr-like helicase